MAERSAEELVAYYEALKAHLREPEQLELPEADQRQAVLHFAQQWQEDQVQDRPPVRHSAADLVAHHAALKAHMHLVEERIPRLIELHREELRALTQQWEAQQQATGRKPVVREYKGNLAARVRWGVQMYRDGATRHPFTLPTLAQYAAHQTRDVNRVLTEIIAQGQPAVSQDVQEGRNTWVVRQAQALSQGEPVWVQEALERHRQREAARSNGVVQESRPVERQVPLDIAAAVRAQADQLRAAHGQGQRRATVIDRSASF